MKYFLGFSIAMILCMGFTSNVFSQDLSGTWEGKESVGGVKDKYQVTYYLAKVDNGYVGISIVSNTETKVKIRSGFHIPTNINLNNVSGILHPKPQVQVTQGNKKDYLSAQIVGAFSNGFFTMRHLGVIENPLNYSYILSTVKFQYENTNGKEKMVSTPDNAYSDGVSRVTELIKKSNDFSEEYAQFKQDILTTSPVNYLNGNKENKVKYNDKGLLSFSITNSSNYDLQNISMKLVLKEKDAGITGLNGNAGTFTLTKGNIIRPNIDIFSGFNLQADSLHFYIQGMYNGVQLFEKDFALATIPFFLTNKTVVNSSSDQVLTTLKSFYGFNNVPSAPVVNNLSQFANSGNNLAPMWKAAFLSRGKGGYPLNEEEAMPLAKKTYNAVLTAARNGDAEGQYLMFYAIGLGLTGDASREMAGTFLKKSADAGFAPAMYDYALYLMKDTNYTESYKYLTACYEKGVQLAAVTIGDFYQQGYSVEKNINQAIDWYHKGEAFGDANAIMRLARLYFLGNEGLAADTKKGVQYATKAVNLKSVAAMDFLADIYLNGRKGIPKSPAQALEYYKMAAALGDNKAMTSLALLYLEGNTGLPKDEKTAIIWAKKSAIAGGARCMVLLSNMYADGQIDGKKDEIKARFWANQARLNGVAIADNAAKQASANDMLNILSNIDLSDKYSYYRDVETGDTYRSNDGPDIVGGIFQGFLGAYSQRQSQQQKTINGFELIYESGGKKVYGATVSSQYTTNLDLMEGQKVNIKAYGSVNLGTFAGIAGPGGTNWNPSLCIDPSIPLGAIMAKAGGNWTYIGNGRDYIAPADGPLQLAMNDTDFIHDIGYFDIVITVTD